MAIKVLNTEVLVTVLDEKKGKLHYHLFRDVKYLDFFLSLKNDFDKEAFLDNFSDYLCSDFYPMMDSRNRNDSNKG